MKATLTRENLMNGLAAAGAAVPTRTTLPVLSNILVEALTDQIRLRATDLDTSIVITIPADVEKTGALTVPGKKFQEIAREMPGNLVLSAKGNTMSVESGRTRFRLNGLEPDEFPALPKMDFSKSWHHSGEHLAQLISQVAFAASTEETRPILNGILWEIHPDFTRMVATNGHRLAKRTVLLGDGPRPEPTSLIISPKALLQVQKLFAPEDHIEVSRSENHIAFRSDDVQIYTRLIEGPYPNYDQVIPKDNDKVLTVDRAALNAAVRRMAIVASDQTHRTRINLGGPLMRLSVQTPDLGEANEELPVEYTGDPIEIGFNAHYLMELLRNMPTDEIRMSFRAPERAATMEPVGAEGLDYLCLIMPLRLLD